MKHLVKNAEFIFNDGINYNTPNYKGLYLIGETHFNPFTKEEYYLIKIGKSDSQLSTRMRSYNTHNPMLWRIDFRRTPSLEREYQDKLANLAIAKCSHNKEWFFVSREIYLDICAKGFNYFDN